MKPQLHYVVLPFTKREEAEAALERSGLIGEVVSEYEFEQDYLLSVARRNGTMPRLRPF